MNVGAVFGDAPLQRLATGLGVTVRNGSSVSDLYARPAVRTGDDSHGSLLWKESTTETRNPLPMTSAGIIAIAN
jgi:hypothetical protein